jgi:magnesium-transporting ATPase (P-type)
MEPIGNVPSASHSERTSTSPPLTKSCLAFSSPVPFLRELLREGAENAKLLNETLEMLTTFAAEGLRTLVIAKAELNEDEYRDWAKRYQEAQCALVDRANKVAAVGEEIEKDLVRGQRTVTLQ